MHQNKLPADSNAMILGIIALVLALTGCCCGLLSLVAVALSIVGLVIANRSLRDYTDNPENYSPQSRSNVYTAKILNIIALVISSLITLIMLLYFAIYGAIFSTVIMEGIRQSESNDWNWEEYDQDGYYYDESEDSIIEDEENDTLYHYQDSIQIEELE